MMYCKYYGDLWTWLYVYDPFHPVNISRPSGSAAMWAKYWETISETL